MQERIPDLSRTRQLLVEGEEEVRVLGALLRYLQIDDLQVWEYGGKDSLGNRLRALIATPAFDQIVSIGIVRDADSSAGSALQSVQSSLRNAGLPVPVASSEPAGDWPRVSIFIMPDNSNDGALEDLCLTALTEDPAMPCVEHFLTCVNGQVAAPPRDQQKARIHAFLASRQDPELRLGEAAQTRLHSLEPLCLRRLKAQFLKDL